MKKVNSIVAILAGVAVVLSLVTYFSKPEAVVGPQGPQGIQGEKGRDGQTLGAVPSPDFYGPYWSVNDVRQYSYSQGKMNGTGSTTCSFKTPSATTTLVSAVSYFRHLATSTTAEINMSPSRYGTTSASVIISKTDFRPAVTGDVIMASSTAESLVVPPNMYINTVIGSGDVEGTTDPVGSCKLTLQAVE